MQVCVPRVNTHGCWWFGVLRPPPAHTNTSDPTVTYLLQAWGHICTIDPWSPGPTRCGETECGRRQKSSWAWLHTDAFQYPLPSVITFPCVCQWEGYIFRDAHYLKQLISLFALFWTGSLWCLMEATTLAHTYYVDMSIKRQITSHYIEPVFISTTARVISTSCQIVITTLSREY